MAAAIAHLVDVQDLDALETATVLYAELARNGGDIEKAHAVANPGNGTFPLFQTAGHEQCFSVRAMFKRTFSS